MRLPYRLRALAAALAACAALGTPAQANDDVNDAIATVTDTVNNLLAGCTPVVERWEPIWKTPQPHIKNASTWYLEEAGGKAYLTCTAAVRMRVRLRDESLRPVWRPYPGDRKDTYMTSKTPSGMAKNDVPYFGPDAPILRPYGKITVHVEVFRRLSTGRYEPIRSGCMEWVYLFQPASGTTVTDPINTKPCAYDAVFLADDALEGTQAVVPLPELG